MQPAIAMADTAETAASAGHAGRDDFSRLVAAHQAAVLGVAYGALGSPVAAEEVAQEAFLVAWRKLAAGEKVDHLAAWLCGIARHLAANARRRRREETAEALDDRPAPGPSPLESALDREAHDNVGRALAALPPRYREPLVLFYFTGQSVREVADALALSEQVVKQRLSRGRRQLKDGVADVERGLTAARPGAAFTAAVVAALATRGSVASAGAAAASAARPATAFGAAEIMAAIAAALALAAGGAWLANARAKSARAAARSDAVTASGDTPGAAAAPGSAPAPLGVRVPGRDPGVARFAQPAGRGLGAGVALRSAIRPGADPAAAEAGADTATADAAWVRLQRTVDLDVRQAVVGDLLRLISDVSEVPIVVHGEIDARVDVRAHDTAAIDVLDEVLRQAGATRTEIPALRIVPGGLSSVAGLFPGAPASVDFKAAPLRDVMSTLSGPLGLPIVVAAEIADTPVTMRVDDVPAGAALEDVLRATGLGCESAVGFEVAPDDSTE